MNRLILQRALNQKGWHRRRRWMSVVANSLPYALVIKLMKGTLKQEAMQAILFQHYIQLIHRFLSVIDTNVDRDQVIQNSLIYGALFNYQIGPWGDSIRENSAHQVYADDFKLEGSEIIHQAVAQKRGVILVRYHDVTRAWFHQLSFERYSEGGVRAYIKRTNSGDKGRNNWLFAQQILAAKQVLQQGGIVTIAGDGHHGRSPGLQYDFHGRRRPFRTGFAQLAIMTDAAVLALVNRIDEDGRVKIRTVGPLDAGNDKMAHAERIQQLVDQYVDLLNKTWAEAPWMVPWFQMETHLAYPPSGELRAQIMIDNA